MSVEDIQKVNKFAQELLDQGIVESREEAVKKAQEMLNKEIAGGDVQVKETEEKQNIAASGSNEDNLRNMIERTKTYMETQFNGYKNALIALEKEIRRLHQEVETLKSRPVPQPTKQQDPAEEPQKVEESAPQDPGTQTKSDSSQEPQKVEVKQESGESHPKVGKTNAEDVSIEKMFYFGNK